MPNKRPEIVAAVDLGSNSFHMIVCSLKQDKLQVIDRLKETVRLASGLTKEGLIDEATQQRAFACLEKFAQRIRHFPLGSVRIVGTNTLRMAKNSAQFIAKAEQILNHPIHVISGIEEARLIYLGVAYSLGSGNNQLRLIMDIGGGSTEYIIGLGNTPKEKESLNMGCVTTTQRFFKDGQLSKPAFCQAVLFAQQHLEPFQKKFNRKNWQQAIGASGSLRSISKVLQTKGWSNNGITKEGLEHLVNRIYQCNHISELNLPELDNERLPVFVGGVAIVYATFKSLGITQMTVADGALREGLIQDLLGRLDNHDIRFNSVEFLTKRYHSDIKQTERVKQTLATMLQQLEKKHTWANDETAVQFLNWAVDLHEIGMDIAHSQYHKHSAYLIENSDLAGFSRQDQVLLATIIRTHRRKIPVGLFNELPSPWHKQSVYLTLILRLAILLHRSRDEKQLPSFKINMDKNKISLKFPKQWLEQLPLTQADLLQEADYLKTIGYKLEFC